MWQLFFVCGLVLARTKCLSGGGLYRTKQDLIQGEVLKGVLYWTKLD
jgi:hypothetical protein